MFSLTPALRKIGIALGAAALALGTMTATALPARANGDDVARVLAGTAALVVLGSALQSRPAYHQPGPPVSRVRPVHPAHGWQDDRRRGGWHHPYPRRGWAPPPPVPHPGVCAVWINGERYVRSSRDCTAARPLPHDPRHGWGAPGPWYPTR